MNCKTPRLPACPNCCTYPRNRPTRVRRSGFFRRAASQKPIQRFFCFDCGRGFSDATFTFEYRQRRRELNKPIFMALASNVSMRRAATIVVTNRKTVDRRLIYFDRVARDYHDNLLAGLEPQKNIQFDDMETSEHTKLKPLAIPLVVTHPNRIIISYDVAEMPAKGHLAALSVKKYGRRQDLRAAAWANVLSRAATVTTPTVVISSDSHKRYPEMIRKHLPDAEHVQVNSRRACVAGQGELKKGGFDPIFSINHTAAMLRANINRLIRKTWCTTKRKDRLLCHISLYVLWHNETILAKLENRKRAFPFP